MNELEAENEDSDDDDSDEVDMFDDKDKEASSMDEKGRNVYMKLSEWGRKKAIFQSYAIADSSDCTDDTADLPYWFPRLTVLVPRRKGGFSCYAI